jgi:hypothetical protein
MSSSSTLRHQYGIRHLSSALKRLYCKLTRAAKALRLLCQEDSYALEEAGVWWKVTNESITLPEGITMEAVHIVFDIHRRIWDIIDAYGGPLLEPPYLFDFFYDLIAKYRTAVDECGAAIL